MTTTASSPPHVSNTLVAVVLVLWLAAAYALGASGSTESLRPPVPQVILLALTAVTILAGALLPGLREWWHAVDLRVPAALHLTRFVGIYFLILWQRGVLPGVFAEPAGIGDIIVASLCALLLLFVGRPTTRWRRRAWIAWNALGLLDILFVVTRAARLSMADPPSMTALLRMPLSPLLTFLVPLIIATHVLIAARMRRV